MKLLSPNKKKHFQNRIEQVKLVNPIKNKSCRAMWEIESIL